MTIGHVDVGAEQLDRALAAGFGKRQRPVGPAKVDRGPIDDRPALGPNSDGAAAGIAEVEVPSKALPAPPWPTRIKTDGVPPSNRARASSVVITRRMAGSGGISPRLEK